LLRSAILVAIAPKGNGQDALDARAPGVRETLVIHPAVPARIFACAVLVALLVLPSFVRGQDSQVAPETPTAQAVPARPPSPGARELSRLLARAEAVTAGGGWFGDRPQGRWKISGSSASVRPAWLPSRK